MASGQNAYAVFSAQVDFPPLPALDTADVTAVFRRLLLRRLHKAERLSENFMRNLLSWVKPGFPVFAGPSVEAAALTSMESQSRYITHPAAGDGSKQQLIVAAEKVRAAEGAIRSADMDWSWVKNGWCLHFHVIL